MIKFNRRTAAGAACVESGNQSSGSTRLSAPETIVVVVVLLIGAALAPVRSLAVPLVIALLGGTSTVAVGIVLAVRANRYPRLVLQGL